MVYYCSDTQVTDLLPVLTNSQIATEAQRAAKLRAPAKSWIDKAYPGKAPFPGMSAADGYSVATAAEDGDFALAVSGGTGTPAAGDIVRFEGHNAAYKVDSYALGIVTLRYVTSNLPGTETATAVGLKADVLVGTPVYFGTPLLLQQAAAWYATSLAWVMLRDDPMDKQAAAAQERAEDLLRMDGGIARAHPYPWYSPARDSVGTRPSSTVIPLVR
jgi:hypothetical protein